jgi:hypothetical protein
MRAWGILAIVAITVVGCRAPGPFGREVKTAAELRQALQSVLPTPVSLDSAVRVLEDAGFTCPVPEQLPGQPWQRWCWWESGGRAALVRRRLTVGVVSRDTFWLNQKLAREPMADSLQVHVGLVGL